MIRRRPIPRSAYSWSPQPKPARSLRYTVILGGAVRVYPDGREVCQANSRGTKEYARRVSLMVERQRYRCSLCGQRLSEYAATFEHQRRRGLGGAFRDDKIVDSEGNWLNSAAHWICNSRKG